MKTTIKADQLKTLVAQADLARVKANISEKMLAKHLAPVSWENGRVTTTVFPLKILASWSATFGKAAKIKLEVGEKVVVASCEKATISLCAYVPDQDFVLHAAVSVDCHGKVAKVAKATVKELRLAKKAALEERERKEKTEYWIRNAWKFRTVQRDIRDIVDHIRELKEESEEKVADMVCVVNEEVAAWLDPNGALRQAGLMIMGDTLARGIGPEVCCRAL